MKGSIYLIGGGEIRDGETIEIDLELKRIAPTKSTFVFFGTAANDNINYINSIKSIFEDRFNVIAPTEKDGPEYAISAIQSASIIYLGGGTTELLLNLFDKWGLVNHLTLALDRGVHIAGMSAGAQALSSCYVHEDGGPVELRRGWGFVPVCILVHANKDSFVRAKTLWRNDKYAYSNYLAAIGEGVAWCVESSGARKIGGGKIWNLDK